ncbi:uncharacterized protein MYCFIDRAFT_211464 [Pseudocercospora fijiensis CIRAD86]|uniref:Uncharacterized protein n=1 Tax=Pseudocercospora fijiensis (strain CIRAD86) TaxID=383855 RepID=M2ZRZ6_PSEFD|nr:uncharacterized protein MYCFIDRAFT_211464 [Pseudocercospora fijiensis CIRAD86]EME81809.1 hypothetical protein MYCFIDRAFT_211464 [Pseudocercospora fijiensis CIRAD86]
MNLGTDLWKQPESSWSFQRIFIASKLVEMLRFTRYGDSPAMGTTFCLQHRQDPEKAIELVGKWVDDSIAIKEQGHNVAASDSQTNSPQLTNRAAHNSAKESPSIVESP